MPKQELEFFNPEGIIPWVAVPPGTGASAEGMVQRLLSTDEAEGVSTRLLKFDPGVETDEVITHDFWEEVIILEGELHDKTLNKTFTAGMYACRPPGMVHGPYSSPNGCLTFEVRYYKK